MWHEFARNGSGCRPGAPHGPLGAMPLGGGREAGPEPPQDGSGLLEFTANRIELQLLRFTETRGLLPNILVPRPDTVPAWCGAGACRPGPCCHPLGSSPGEGQGSRGLHQAAQTVFPESPAAGPTDNLLLVLACGTSALEHSGICCDGSMNTATCSEGSTSWAASRAPVCPQAPPMTSASRQTLSSRS